MNVLLWLFVLRDGSTPALFVCVVHIVFVVDFQSPSTVIGKGYEFELWTAGYYTVVHFPNHDLTVLWDRKTTIHIRAGPRWKVKVTTSPFIDYKI